MTNCGLSAYVAAPAYKHFEASVGAAANMSVSVSLLTGASPWATNRSIELSVKALSYLT